MRSLSAAVVLVLGASLGGCGDAPVVERVEAPAGVRPVVLAAGDIADCDGGAKDTAQLLADHGGVVAAVGDLAYPDGSPAAFEACYAPTWGALQARTRPALGNHDVEGGDARGYFGFFDDAQVGPRPAGYYSYDLGAWHVVVLNSNCEFAGGCGDDSAQVQWLRDDLAATATDNVLAYWHHPRYSTGQHGDTPAVDAFWDVLVEAGADVAVTAHDHDYQRFIPLDADGEPADGGLRQFVVGTGGADLRPFATTSPHVAHRQDDHHGILRLDLDDCGYRWQFLAAGAAEVLDEGRQTSTC